MHPLRRILCVLFLFLSASLSAQDEPQHDFIISAQGHAGYILGQHNYINYLIKGHIYAGEINYMFRTNGKKQWQQIHNYPEIGICGVHIYLANNEQLGTVEALYPYTNIRLNKQSKKLATNLRLGFGLAYVTNPFNRVENHKNNVIGTNWNGFVNLRYNITRMIGKSWRVDAGVGLSHASNGAIKTPNLGLNMCTINLGAGYVFGNKDIVLKHDTIAKLKRQWHPSVILVAGIKELMPPGGNKYMAYGMQVNFNRTLNYKNKIGGGVEASYTTATAKHLENDSILNYTAADILRVGIKFNYAFIMHRISVPVEFGVYVYDKRNIDGLFFHRVGLRYMINKHLIANLTLITHWAVADYFEWGLGYQF